MDKDHAIGEASFVEQYERQMDAVRERACARTDDDRGEEQLRAEHGG